MPLARLALLVALSFSSSGCTLLPFWPDYQPNIEVASLASGDLLVTTGDLDRTYEELAVLAVGPRGDNQTDELLSDLRLAARQAGADAVVRVDFDVYGAGESGYSRWVATGTAVRFR